MNLLLKSIALLVLIFSFALALKAQENATEVRKTLEMADAYFASGDFINAKASYQIAVKMAPEDTYAKDRLQQSLDLIKVQMQQNVLYTEKILKADELYKQNDLENALRFYKSALADLPGDTYANERVRQIEQSFADAAKREADYQASLANGEKFLAERNLQGSLTEYKKAASLKPEEDYPRQKVTEVEKLLADQRNTEGSYEKAMADADIAVQRKKFDDAILHLENASKLKPEAEEPKIKLADVQKMKQEHNSYAAIIENADNLYINKDFDQAKAEYQKAVAMKPEDEYPKSMLDKIEIALMDISDANRSSYEVAIARADKLYNEQDYDLAMVEYKNALHFQPEGQYAKQRISDINNALSLRKSKDEAYAQSISRADQLFKEERYEESREEYNRAIGFRPLEEYPKVKIDEIGTIMANLQNQRQIYDNLITGADKLFFADDYEESREQYRKASDLFPREQYPLDQIKMITEIIGRREMYTKAVTEADRLMYEKKYEEALAEYKKAAALNENDEYTQGKINEIESLIANEEIYRAVQRNYDSLIILADNHFNAGDYTAAMETYKAARAKMPAQAYPKKQMDEINRIAAERQALDNKYAESISNGDNLLGAKDYQNALTAFQNASALKPGEEYPASKIAEINVILGELANKEALDKQYAEVVANADNLLIAKDYQNALLAYKSAQALKPSEKYPSVKVAEINKTLDDLSAKEALEKKFVQLKSEAEALYAQQNYTEAKKKFEAAALLKPDDPSVKTSIKEIDLVLADLAKVAKEDEEYNEAIAFGDKHLAAQKYEYARGEYMRALGIKVNQPYPMQKLAEIDAIEEGIRKQKELDEDYRKAIAEADQFMLDLQFEEARFTYQEALKLKPGEDYPEMQIIKINRELEAMALERDKAYQITLSKAENYLQQQEYEMAKIHFERAIEIKPEEVYPLDKLKFVNEEIMKKRQITQEEYDKSIADADKYYASKLYDNAIESYRASTILKPDEEYPKEMIRRILKMLSERSIVQMNKDPLLIANNTQHKFEFFPVPVKDRKSNYIYFRAKNASQNEYKLIINFGKDQSKNGGIVVKVPAETEIKEFIIRISAQYKWFSDDNNWITFYPEGGDLEVSLLQISYSD